MYMCAGVCFCVCSRQMAEEVLRGGGGGGGDIPGFEGMEALAQAIELGKCVCVCVCAAGVLSCVVL